MIEIIIGIAGLLMALYFGSSRFRERVKGNKKTLLIVFLVFIVGYGIGAFSTGPYYVHTSYDEIVKEMEFVRDSTPADKTVDCEDYAIAFYNRGREKNWDVSIVIWEIEYLGGHMLNDVVDENGDLVTVEPQGMVDNPYTRNDEVVDYWSDYFFIDEYDELVKLYEEYDITVPTQLIVEEHIITKDFAESETFIIQQ